LESNDPGHVLVGKDRQITALPVAFGIASLVSQFSGIAKRS
jgi:hypothetical protein